MTGHILALVPRLSGWTRMSLSCESGGQRSCLRASSVTIAAGLTLPDEDVLAEAEAADGAARDVLRAHELELMAQREAI